MYELRGSSSRAEQVIDADSMEAAARRLRNAGSRDKGLMQAVEGAVQDRQNIKKKEAAA